MKFSENWLRSLVDIPADRAALVERLTMSGLEVESVEAIGSQLDGVIIAQIIDCAPHPNADKLRVCRVDTGNGEVQIVCGAPNARAGLKTPLAKVGAALPGGTTIKAAKLREVESQGMLCSAKELGIDVGASGLMELPDDAPVGAPLAQYLGLPDAAIELKLTPNRADCLGMLGLAHEAAAEFGTQIKSAVVAPIAPQLDALRTIRLEAGADCPRYLGRSVRGAGANTCTPTYMSTRLRAAGIKTINAVVDVCNYVMLELGQPLHAFDESTLAGDIFVRRARAGEMLKLLDDNEAKLDPECLVIADETKPLALAGVMGGFDSRVTEATRDVFLEAAHFAPATIMGRARKFGLNTDAAHRFERGVDPELPRAAIERATALLIEIAGGKPGAVIEAVSPKHLPQRMPILLRRAHIARVLGIEIADDEVQRIFSALAMHIESQQDGWRVTPPGRRFDIEREEDLIEELARIHGYAAIPAKLPAGEPPPPTARGIDVPASALRAQLAARSYHEAICYAFVDAQRLCAWQMDDGAMVLANPLSAEMAVMRTSLLPGLVDALCANRNRQQPRVRLFEIGNSFHVGKADAPSEVTRIAAVACGNAHAEQWSETGRALDFFDIKGDLQSLIELSSTPQTWSCHRNELPAWLHPGRGARVLRDGVMAGAIGALHPRLLQELDLDEDVHAFELALPPLRARALPRAQPLPRFPSVRRDLAIELPESIDWSQIEACVRSTLDAALAHVLVFDVYTGPGLTSGRKSVAMGLILQDASRTLTDQDADRCTAAVMAALERDVGARLRG